MMSLRVVKDRTSEIATRQIDSNQIVTGQIRTGNIGLEKDFGPESRTLKIASKLRFCRDLSFGQIGPR